MHPTLTACTAAMGYSACQSQAECFTRTCCCRNWSIVVTGHSLGAGAAVLVALYIRSFYPKSRAWAFEPPGGLVDGQLARASSDCVTSVVLGKDWVPRLSIASFERLRDEMVRSLCCSPALPQQTYPLAPILCSMCDLDPGRGLASFLRPGLL